MKKLLLEKLASLNTEAKFTATVTDWMASALAVGQEKEAARFKVKRQEARDAHAARLEKLRQEYEAQKVKAEEQLQEKFRPWMPQPKPPRRALWTAPSPRPG